MPPTFKPSELQMRWQSSGKVAESAEWDQHADLPGCTVWPERENVATAKGKAMPASSAGTPTMVSSKYASTAMQPSIPSDSAQHAARLSLRDIAWRSRACANSASRVVRKSSKGFLRPHAKRAGPAASPCSIPSLAVTIVCDVLLVR